MIAVQLEDWHRIFIFLSPVLLLFISYYCINKLNAFNNIKYVRNILILSLWRQDVSYWFSRTHTTVGMNVDPRPSVTELIAFIITDKQAISWSFSPTFLNDYSLTVQAKTH